MQTLYFIILALFISCGKAQNISSPVLPSQEISQHHLKNLQLINFAHDEIITFNISHFHFQLSSHSNYYLEKQLDQKNIPLIPIELRNNFEAIKNESVVLFDYSDIDPHYNLSWLYFPQNKQEEIQLKINFQMSLFPNQTNNLKRIKLLLVFNNFPLRSIEINDPHRNNILDIDINMTDLKVTDIFPTDLPEFNLKLLVTDSEYYLPPIKIANPHFTIIQTVPMRIIQHSQDDSLKNVLKLVDPEVQLDSNNNILNLFNLFSNQTTWERYSLNNTHLIQHQEKTSPMPILLNKQNNQTIITQPFFLPIDMDLELKISAYNERYQTYTTNEYIPYDSPRQGDGRGRVKGIQGCSRVKAHLSNQVVTDQLLNFQEIQNHLDLCQGDDCQVITNDPYISSSSHLVLTLRHLKRGEYTLRWRHNPEQSKIALDYISQSGSHCNRGNYSKRMIDAFKLQQLKLEYVWKNFEK